MQRKANLKFLKVRFFLIILVILGLLIYSFSKKSEDNCQNLNSKSEKLTCWEKLFDFTLKNKGIDQAFGIVERLYKEDPVFVSNCHDFVHLIGEKTYQLFSNKRDFSPSAKTSYCGYGFYHSFMESLLKDGGDLAKARQFCDYVDRKMSNQNTDVKGACYHGIGHGVADNHDQKEWKDEKDLVESALTLCEKVAEDKVMLNRCSSGVFNVLAIAYISNRLDIPADPLWFCHQQQNNIYKKTCYEEMNTALFVFSEKDFTKAASFLEKVEKDEFALSGIRSLAGVFGMSQVQNNDFSKIINDCRKIQQRLTISCFKGYAAGLIEGGNPSKEYEKALEFCQDDLLKDEEKAACFEEVLRLSNIYYPREKQEKICNLVEDKYKKYCL